jgi:predicted glutamine amidotransferase
MAQSEMQPFICDPDGDITLILHNGAPAEEPDTNADELEDVSSSESTDLSSTEGEETEIEPGQ